MSEFQIKLECANNRLDAAKRNLVYWRDKAVFEGLGFKVDPVLPEDWAYIRYADVCIAEWTAAHAKVRDAEQELCRLNAFRGLCG